MLHTPSGPTTPLTRLAPEAALQRLELIVVRRLEGFLHRDHLGLLPGPGSDASDARPCQPGQDGIRTMDWAVTARITVPRIRDITADRKLEVWGLLGMTPSIDWGTEDITKYDLGIAVIATIGFLSQRMGDRFGDLMILPDHIKQLPTRSGRTALYGMLRQILTEPIVPDSAPGDLEPVDDTEQMVHSQRHRGMWVVVPDFLTSGEAELDPDWPLAWEWVIRRPAVRNQTLCVEVVDKHELEFPNVGETLICDPETSSLRYINTLDPAVRRRTDDASRAQHERIKVVLGRTRTGHIQLRTDRDWVSDIARFILGYQRIANALRAPPQGVSR